jgi:A/G-specific adenine glycosylase
MRLQGKKHARDDDAVRKKRRTVPRIDRERLARFQRRLLAWYRRNGRDLPWRRTRDPYAILVSEIMLQQTQVRRVLDFYPKFLARYPTVEDLAAASESVVRESWQGLGYYRRAANLRRTAQLVARRHSGRFPTDVAALARLPGVGRYTAGAVASFAFEQDAPILDTNAARVLARVFGHGRRRGRIARLWLLAEAAIPRGRGYDFNQAIMDLGALMCRPRPTCHPCPVRGACAHFTRTRSRVEIDRAALRRAAQK